MGGDSGGGDSGGYDAAPMQYSQQKKKRELEERRVQMAEMEDRKGYYARSGSGSVTWHPSLKGTHSKRIVVDTLCIL